MGSPSAAPKQKTILVVDDDASIRGMVAKALSTRYKVIEAADGLIASEILGRPPPPDLLICDVMMPRVDGFSLAKLIRARSELENMPIVFLTAKTAPQSLIQGIQLGAKHYIQKPFSVKDLLERVTKLLK